MSDPAILAELLRSLLIEGRRRVHVLSAVFSAIALGALAFGVLKPKTYVAQSIVHVEASNIIKPLMEGRAVPTGVTDQVSIVSQTVLSRRILREVMVFGGWGEPGDPLLEQRLLDKLASRIRVASQGPQLIRISYSDTDPQRCYDIAAKLAEIYIREGMIAKERESRDAFDFIDKQVVEYGTKLAEAHGKVLAYYRGDEVRDAESNSTAQAKPAPPARRPALSPGQLAALRSEEAALVADVESGESRRQRRAERTAQLERELDTLRMVYTDQHPNVKRASEELRIHREEAERAAALDDGMTKAARLRLEQVRSRLMSAAQVPASGPSAPAPPPDPEMRGVGQDSTFAELLRRYEATRDVYQDLLKRRENARVSMELDAEHRGFTLRIHEPAEMPVVPVSMRLLHVTMVGLVLGVLAPLGVLLALVRLDPRVRSAGQIERAALVPVLVSIPFAQPAHERTLERRRWLLAGGMVVCVFAAYAAFFVMRVKLAS